MATNEEVAFLEISQLALIDLDLHVGYGGLALGVVPQALTVIGLRLVQ